MKVLYVDNCIIGHHTKYLKSLAKKLPVNSCFVLPSYIDEIDIKKQHLIDIDIERKNPFGYIRYIKFIKNIAKEEKVDIIHFLSIDPLLKYFGWGFRSISKHHKIICTYHHLKKGKVHDLARKMMFMNINCCVVHTDSIVSILNHKGIKNCAHIEYPVFEYETKLNVKDCRNKLGIKTDNKVILALGGTRYNKGLDILLDALSKVNVPFELLIAGQEEYFTRKEIEKKIESYKENVHLVLKYLSDRELEECLVASDIICLPYRKCFDGASGPLAEGVIHDKCMIGPDHGSLGKIIKSNHLGMTFKSENSVSLSKVIIDCIVKKFYYDSHYLDYKYKISEKEFVSSYLDIYQKINANH